MLLGQNYLFVYLKRFQRQDSFQKKEYLEKKISKYKVLKSSEEIDVYSVNYFSFSNSKFAINLIVNIL